MTEGQSQHGALVVGWV